MNSNIRQMYPIGQMFFIPQLMKDNKNQVQDIYSETEVKTNGIWIDGKPIYRIVVKSKTPTKSEYKNIYNATNLNVNELVKTYGILIGTDNFIDINGSYAIRLGYNYNGKYFWIQNTTNSSPANIDFVAVFEYTKTTD